MEESWNFIDTDLLNIYILVVSTNFYAESFKDLNLYEIYD